MRAHLGRTYVCVLQTIFIFFLILFSGCGGGGSSSTGGSNNSPAPNPVPMITSLSPATATVGNASATVAVTGSGFISSSVVQWNQAARPTTFVSATQLQFSVSSSDLGSAGTAEVVVVNPTPGGGRSNPTNFTVNNPAPSITSISPPAIVVGAGAFVVTVTGSSFVSSSTVTYNGLPHVATLISSTQLTIQLSTSDLASIGSFPVSVANPAPGGGSANSTFEVTSLFAHAYSGSFPTGSEILVSVNPVTGNTATIGTVTNSGSIGVIGGLAAIDPVGHRYFFLELTPANAAILHTIDTKTGTELGQVALAPSVILSAMKFDSSSGKIFGHAYQGTFPTGNETLASVDPASGSVATVGIVPNSHSLGTPQAVAALDAVGHRYFFVEVSPTNTAFMHVIDTRTGAELSKLPLSLTPTALQFDSSGKIFGFAYQGAFPNGNEVLVSVDPTSGNVTTVGTIPNSGSLSTPLGGAALDIVSHRYFLVEASQMNVSILHVIDTNNGAELGKVTLFLLPSALSAGTG